MKRKAQLRESALNATGEIELDAQPAHEAERLAELHEQAEVAPHFVLEPVGVAQREVERPERGRLLVLGIEDDLKRREELHDAIGINEVLDTRRKEEIVGGGEVGLDAEAQVSDEIERVR